MELTPSLILAMWIAGMALGGAIVAIWKVVGPGYLWLTAGVVVLFGVGAIVADGGPLAVIGTVVAATAGIVGRKPQWSAGLFAVAALLFGAVAFGDSPWFPVFAGVLFLGGVTSEMTLGHWYLVDPRLPRWALQRLALVGAVGLAGEIGYVLWKVGAPWTADDTFLGWAFVALAIMTALLVAGVWFSLKEPSYTGVMAATGLSYLAVLTAFGVAMVARQLTFV